MNMFAFGSTLPIIILFIISSLTVILYLRYKHIEKLELIKKGDNLIYQDELQQMKYNNLIGVTPLLFIGFNLINDRIK